MKGDAMIADIWASFRRMPLWVQIWVALILVPVNVAALALLGAPNGLWIAVLAVGGMLPNLGIMIRERGFSKAMALPHVLIWTPLVVLLLITPKTPLIGLILAVDLVSLGFDYPDTIKWLRGDRGVA